MLNTDAQERGFLEAVGDAGDDMGSGPSQYHGYLSQADKKYEDTYSEELISLVPKSGESKYTAGHYGSNPNTLISYRKVIIPPNAVKTTDGANIDTGVYKIVEMQSDWIQDGRQYGFTHDEYDDIGDKLRIYDKDLTKQSQAITVFEDSMEADFTDVDMAWAALQDIPNYIFKAAYITSIKKTAHTGILNQFGAGGTANYHGALSTATMHSPEFKKDMEDFDLNTKTMEKGINLTWENSTENPASANFDMEEFWRSGAFRSIDNYLDHQKMVTERKIDEWEDHSIPARTPLKHKDIYITTGLQDAIQKAHAKGLKYVSWSSSSQILDKWNRSRDLNEKGNIRYQELYGNIYDKQLPNAARKLLEKYKGGKLKEMEIDGEINYVIEITPELIENMRKALPNLPEDSKVIPLPQYGKANQIDSGLLKTDIIEQGLLA